MAEPFCFVAEKGGRCLGVCAPDDALLSNFYKQFVGYEIKPLGTRADWDDYRNRVPFGHDTEDCTHV
jgi:hypothetical protein